jgi:uncharacterized protein YbjT (DUF2867 family)
MGKIAVVIGATGVVGREVVNLLAKAEHIDRVHALTRRSVDYTDAKIENHVVDFAQLDEYKDLLQGDLLFSCLGTTKKQAGSIEAQRVVDYDYQYQAAQLAAANGVAHYLLVSSGSANVNSSSAYLKMKGELEGSTAQLGFKNVSIFQPSLLIGERKDVRMGEKIGSALLPVLCELPGLSKYRPITGAQVAAKMVQVSNADGAGLSRYVLDEIFI